jgi:hypothetical protein
MDVILVVRRRWEVLAYEVQIGVPVERVPGFNGERGKGRGITHVVLSAVTVPPCMEATVTVTEGLSRRPRLCGSRSQ